jgi:hypothetical protein
MCAMCHLGKTLDIQAQGTTAHALAALRDGLLMLFRQAHWFSVPDALADYATSVARADALIGLQVKT